MDSRRRKVATTPAELTAALRQAKRYAPLDRRVEHVSYDARNDRIRLSLADGVEVAIPRHLLQGLHHAARKQLADIEILGRGTGLHWPQLNVDHYVPGLLNRVFGTEHWMRTIGQRGGAARSPAKAAAARANGRRGGRPARRAG